MRAQIIRAVLFGIISSLAYISAVRPSLASTPRPDEVIIGPLDYQQNVNGVVVNIRSTTFIKIVTQNDKIYLESRVVGDLSDLQKKIGTIIDTFDLPRDNCKSFSPKNPVVSIPRKELTFRDGTALLSIGANVTVWACVENPVPNSKAEWEMYNFGFMKTKCRPRLITWPGSPIKTHVGSQNFDADLPVRLIKDNEHAVGISVGKPGIDLGDCTWFACIAKGALKLGGVDVNQKAYEALQKAIDPEKLRLSIPDDLERFNPNVVSADFLLDDGSLAAEIKLSALVPGAAVTDLIKELLTKSKK